jgi:hypothetical protein
MIRLTIPSIEQDDLDAVRDALASGYLVQGPRVAAFEAALAESIGVPHVVADREVSGLEAVFRPEIRGERHVPRSDGRLDPALLHAREDLRARGRGLFRKLHDVRLVHGRALLRHRRRRDHAAVRKQRVVLRRELAPRGHDAT